VTTPPAINFIAGDNDAGDKGVLGVYMDPSSHGGLNENIEGSVRIRRPCPTSAAGDITVLI
jgi:hypothetical protein